MSRLQSESAEKEFRQRLLYWNAKICIF